MRCDRSAVVRVRGAARAAESDRAATEEPLKGAFAQVKPFAADHADARRRSRAGRRVPARRTRDRRRRRPRHDRDAPMPQPITPRTSSTSRWRTDRRRRWSACWPGGARSRPTPRAACAGGRTIESLAADVAPIAAAWRVSGIDRRVAGSASRATGRVRRDRRAASAGLFARDGRLVDVAEDVGRHNAVDKIVGRMLMREALPLSDHLLCVTTRFVRNRAEGDHRRYPDRRRGVGPLDPGGRPGAGCGLTLIGFIRGDRFNIYAARNGWG